MNGSFSERGQGLVEYVLILVLIAVVVVLAVTALGESTTNMFSDMNDELTMIPVLLKFV